MVAATIRVGIGVVLAVLAIDPVSAYDFHGRPGYTWSTTPGPNAPLPANQGIYVEKSVVEDGYRVSIYLGKLKPTDIQINIGPRGIALQSARTNSFDRTEAHSYYHAQRYVQFSRLVPVPHDADTEMASTNYRNGILEILLPRRQ